IVTAPKPPGSRQLISPPAAVLEIAPAKVLHGAVRLHGLTSSPTPETQVRVGCANAGDVETQRLRIAAETARPRVPNRVMSNPPCSCGKSIIVQIACLSCVSAINKPDSPFLTSAGTVHFGNRWPTPF